MMLRSLIGLCLLFGCYSAHDVIDFDSGVRLDAGVDRDVGAIDVGAFDSGLCGAVLCAPLERCCLLCGDEGLCVGPREPCPAIECPPEGCAAGCADREWCSFGGCDSDGLGRCVPLPNDCLGETHAVCSCEDRFYPSTCEAEAAGADVFPRAADGLSQCRVEALDAMCRRLCELIPVCSDDPLPVECDEFCATTFASCDTDSMLLAYDCAALEGCDAIENCFDRAIDCGGL